ncbi:TetR/AcrR family transcriptional regulator C-terminal domain-containing protein [Streptomyces malaysiensis subsp. malaysiensis]|uniref:TetR/AcrR family transcriptional regulator C-terminal domain-containing protein n=1 Tax=Streptomyces malaysiensis TaxID=92644 RepID=A0ABX6WLB4_STRMQ|nr:MULTISPECIES: TetR/AcrR family transcriptional regulator C-terminal domain-containing protein [Streptomyces]QPI61339.1 TetR/AcrR family transcriptional regulator C-terminal domain-containing protein [Streptomyces solisilvae]UHH23111.1 TetR/AcrR family transcriptional regulator C-terminal domain-containing protein [Streptomyces sp. HNM0561]
MPRTRGRAPAGGRADALSREVVVGTAIALLDELGERGLTFRLLAERLQTGTGALYWHVSNKDELVALAADQVLGPAVAADLDPAQNAGTALRALAMAVFDAFDQHPWAAPHVTAPPTLTNALRLLDRIGTLVTRTEQPAEQHFAVTTAIFYYITGVSAQITVPRVPLDATTGRDAYLAQTAERWQNLDPADYPFLTRATDNLRDHADRDQFTTGLDLLLRGLITSADTDRAAAGPHVLRGDSCVDQDGPPPQ